jgi:hypothetical protein
MTRVFVDTQRYPVFALRTESATGRRMQHVVVAVARTHAPTLGRCDPQYISFRSALIHERSIVAEQRVGGKAIGLVRLSSTVSMSVEHQDQRRAFMLAMARPLLRNELSREYYPRAPAAPLATGDC